MTKARQLANTAGYNNIPVDDLVALAAIPEADLIDKTRRYVEDETTDYFYNAEAVAGDIAPDDQTGGTGFWVESATSGADISNDPWGASWVGDTTGGASRGSLNDALQSLTKTTAVVLPSGLTALAALSTSGLSNYTRFYVLDEKAIFVYDEDAVTGDVTPDDQIGGTGFWIRYSNDTHALHSDVAGEINALATGTATVQDWLVFEDQSDSLNKKKTKIDTMLSNLSIKKADLYTYYVRHAAGSTNTFAIINSSDFLITSYDDKLMYLVTWPEANTGAATLNVDSQGAIDITFNGAALVGGELDPDVPTWVVYDSASGDFIITAVANSTGGTEFADDQFRIQDDGDATKEIAFQASGITTSTTRTINMRDANVDLDDAASLGSGAATDGQVLTANGAGESAWEDSGGSAGANLLHVQHTETSGTNAGSASAGANTKPLNTVVTNDISGASLSSDQITLPAGTYTIDALSTVFRVNRHQAYLYDVTNAVVLVSGISGFSDEGADGSSGISRINGSFTLAGEADLEIRHYVETAEATTGLGVAASSGNDELYVDARIWDGTPGVSVSGMISYDFRTGFIDTPASSAVIDTFVVPRDWLLPADLAGSVGTIGTNPTSSFEISIEDDLTEIATITISTDGVFTFATESNEAKLVAAGSVVKFNAPSSADVTAAEMSVTLVGTV